MQQLRKTGDDQLSAQRWQADQAARDQPAQALRDAALDRAGELAKQGRLAESRRVLTLNYFSEEAK